MWAVLEIKLKTARFGSCVYMLTYICLLVAWKPTPSFLLYVYECFACVYVCAPQTA